MLLFLLMRHQAQAIPILRNKYEWMGWCRNLTFAQAFHVLLLGAPVLQQGGREPSPAKESKSCKKTEETNMCLLLLASKALLRLAIAYL